MNIAYFGVYTKNAVNGVDVTGYIVAKEIAKLGHNVYCYGFGDENKTYIEDGINIRIFKKGGKFSLPKAFKEHVEINSDKIEIHHLRSVFILNNYLFSQFLKKINVPYVITPHGGYDQNILKRGAFVKKIYFNLFEKRYLHNAKGVISCSGVSEVEDAKRHNYKGLVEIIWDPVYNDLNFTPKNNKKLIYLGRYDKDHKGLDKLLYLFKEITKLDTEFSLDLYGSGPHESDLIELKNSLNIDGVTINKPVYEEEKNEILNDCMAYIQVSRWEAFGRSIVEAISQGLPVIISEGFNLKDIVEENNLGIVITDDFQKSAQQIIGYLSNYEGLLKISKNNIEFAKNEFSPAIVAQANVDFYQKILN